MIRRTWLSGLGLALLAAACAFSVYIVAAWGLSIAAPNLWFDANNRARIVDDIQHTASSLTKQHKSRAQIAQAIVARVNEISGYSVAVIDGTGKLLAGDRQLIPERPA
ncbi:MAG TPA: hypothetical protein VGQ96_00160, partial [Candidatus Eremiobacteraceae bacterium]|nr:hypothetical protein [Candidatus Eremiobacteraceae bacterium]